MSRLGCGTHRAYITGHCGSARICDIGEIATDIRWNRRLDEISDAEVHVPVGGTGENACCECLGDVEPWCHELFITRDDQVVWEGPITSIEYGYEEIVIFAHDVAAWLSVRVLEAPLGFDTIPADLSVIAQAILDSAFADEDTPCVLPYVLSSPTGLVGTRPYGAYTGPTQLDDWQNLAETGLDYTVINRSIIFGGQLLPLKPIGVLTDELVLGEIKITKDGNLMGNRWFIKWKNGVAVAEAADKQCYGLIERIKDFSNDILDVTNAQATADAYLAATSIAPRVIEFPEGSRISPEAPWDIMDMIPGCRMDVALSRLCFNAVGRFRLTSVAVHDSADSDEEITVALSPVDLGEGTI